MGLQRAPRVSMQMPGCAVLSAVGCVGSRPVRLAAAALSPALL